MSNLAICWALISWRLSAYRRFWTNASVSRSRRSAKFSMTRRKKRRNRDSTADYTSSSLTNWMRYARVASTPSEAQEWEINSQSAASQDWLRRAAKQCSRHMDDQPARHDWWSTSPTCSDGNSCGDRLARRTGRPQILEIHTKKMRHFKLINSDVDPAELAAVTKYFSGAELKELVRAAQSLKLTRLNQSSANGAFDTSAMKKHLVTRNDFLRALNNDIKPTLTASSQKLENFITQGIINWGPPVSAILEETTVQTKRVRFSKVCGVFSLFLWGPLYCRNK